MAGSATAKKSPKKTKADANLDLRRVLFADIIPADRIKDPSAYPEAIRKIRHAGTIGVITTMDTDRLIKQYEKACFDECQIPIEQAASLKEDPLLNMQDLMERTDNQLLKLQQAINDLDSVRLDLNVKKKWLLTIQRLLQIRKQCRLDAAAFWLYVGKDDNPQRAGQQIEYAPCHVLMFAIWNDEDYQNSLIEAPVGHGKSTCMRGQLAWEIGTMPELRHLYITESKELAQRTVGTLRRIVRSGRYKAIFPDLYVLDRKQKAEDSAKCFTVGRLNDLAKDPTLTGVGYRSSIQGSRFDRIWPDDICPQDVRHQALMRAQNNDKWNDVVRTRLAHPKFSRVRMIGTPWHQDDVLGQTARAIKDGKLGDWRLEIDAFRIKIDRETDRPIPIWPEVWDAESLQHLRNTLSSWPFTHELRFGDEDSRIIRRLHYYNSTPGPDDPPGDAVLVSQLANAERWLSIDPSGTGATWSSGQGVIEFVISPNGWVFLTHVYFFRCGSEELLEKLAELLHDPSAPNGTRFYGTQWEVAGGVKVGFAAMRRVFNQILEERGVTKGHLKMVESGTKFGGVRQMMSKKARWENAAPYFERGSVRLAGRRVNGRTVCDPIPGTPMARLADLLLTWDGDKRTSDAIDAASQFILWNQARIAAPQVKAPIVYRQPEKQYSAMHMMLYHASQALLNQTIETDPMDAEQEFEASLSRGVA